MNDFKVGDIVVLKSETSYPKMTINYIETYAGFQKAKCIWYNSVNNSFEHIDIFLGALQLFKND